ncbi:MAG: nicotinate-nucleotide adenylyltransferase [Nitrospinae bacterium]|nr:nicotinate-nucleotide adenylyltransferase [Nitrospinota bacterium]
MRTMRIGIIGGTFNPIHYGHLNFAVEITEIFRLEKVIFIPTFISPHKDVKDVIEPHHRLKMTELAVESNPRFSVSPIEIERKGFSYSIETINELKRIFDKEIELFFIMGIDAFLEVHTWKDVKRLFQSCNFIVSTRPSYRRDNFSDVILNFLREKYKDIQFELLRDDEISGTPKITISISNYAIFAVKTTSLNISSTEIRKRISEGRTVKYLLPEKVENYIMDNKLYHTTKAISYNN